MRANQHDTRPPAGVGPASLGDLDGHGRQRPLVARTRERHQQIHERIERGDSLRAIAREPRLSRGTVLRFARAADVEQRLVAATNRPSVIDDCRLCLHHRWMEGCTNAAALTREIQQLGYRGDINTVRRHLRPYRTGTIPTDAPLPHLTVRRVTDWIMRRPELLTDTERKCLDELCERSPALATTAPYARRLAAIVRERRSEHLAHDVWLADVRLDGQREPRTLAAGIRRDHAAVLAALTTTFTSGAVEGNVTRIKLLKDRCTAGPTSISCDAASSCHLDQPTATPRISDRATSCDRVHGVTVDLLVMPAETARKSPAWWVVWSIVLRPERSTAAIPGVAVLLAGERVGGVGF